MYFKKSSVAIVVYSLDSENSLRNIRKLWLPLLDKHLHIKKPENEIIIVLFGNKSDLFENLNEKERDNSEEIEMIKNEYEDCKDFIGSAKTGEGIK